MSFIAVPLDMISEPNNWAPLPDGRWVIIGNNAVDLWMQLNISDSLGERRYIPAAGATLKLVFQRADLLEQVGDRRVLTSTPRSVEKNAVLSTDDRSLMKIALTSQDVENIVSGSIKFTLTESSKVTTWVQNWIIQKQLTDPGF